MLSNNQVEIPNILLGKEAREVIHAGIKVVSDVVGSTLGPKGRNVTFYGLDKQLLTTKDGVTVASWIDIKDPLLSVGAEMIKSASKHAVQVAGDGTTTATVLTEALVSQLGHLAEEHSPVMINKHLSECLELSTKFIEERSQEVDGLAALVEVATISANNNSEMGTMVAKAVWDAGDNGKVRIVKTQALETTVVSTDGNVWDNGYLVNSCVTNPSKQTFELTDGLMLCLGGDVEDLDIPFLDRVFNLIMTQKINLLVVVQNLSDVAIGKLNAVNHNLAKHQIPHRIATVRAAGHGNDRITYMSDLLNLVGKNICMWDVAETSFDESNLVPLKSALVDAHQTSIQLDGVDSVELETAINSLREAKETTSDHFDRSRLDKRIDILSGKLVTIQVGGISDEDTGERNDLIDDAVRACQCARIKGILPGGGNVYRWLSDKFEAMGMPEQGEDSVKLKTYSAFAEAMLTPHIRLMYNAGYSPEEVTDNLLKLKDKTPECGFNALTGEYHSNLLAAGIVDPTVVSISSLTAAVGVTRNILMTDSIVIPHQYIK